MNKWTNPVQRDEQDKKDVQEEDKVQDVDVENLSREFHLP